MTTPNAPCRPCRDRKSARHADAGDLGPGIADLEARKANSSGPGNAAGAARRKIPGGRRDDLIALDRPFRRCPVAERPTRGLDPAEGYPLIPVPAQAPAFRRKKLVQPQIARPGLRGERQPRDFKTRATTREKTFAPPIRRPGRGSADRRPRIAAPRRRSRPAGRRGAAPWTRNRRFRGRRRGW